MASTSEQGLCLPLLEALEKLPQFMHSKDKHEQDDLKMFLSQVDELHKPDSQDASATSILNYIRRILESPPQRGYVASQEGTLTRSEAFNNTLELPGQFTDITGDIAAEIASKANDNVDSHDITISVLNRLHQYSWETKVALTVTTYILTFGNLGLNLCAASKVTLDDISMFIKQLLEITGYIAEFKKLPTAYMTSTDPNIKDGRTHLIVAVYWIIRAIIDNATSHVTTISSSGYKFSTAISPPSDEKLEAIGAYLKTKLLVLQDLLEEDVDIEAYNKIKEIVDEEHSDNLKVLNALISSNDDAPQLYDGSANKLVRATRVHLNELEEKYVLLHITDLDVNSRKEIRIVDYLLRVASKKKQTDFSANNGKLNYKFVSIPVLDPLIHRHTNITEIEHQKLRSLVNWYVVDNPRMIKNEAIKFFRDDWNFEGEPIVVVLDPQGKVVNKNALPMMFVWGDLAFPFTTTREMNLWDKETWRLDLLLDDIDSMLKDRIVEDKYTFIFGGVDVNWMKLLNTYTRTLSLPLMNMVYLGKSYSQNRVKFLSESEMSFARYFPDPIKRGYFWRRIESMIYSMTLHHKVDVVFQEIQRLHDYDKSSNDWAILAKGNEILFIGIGRMVLQVLENYELWKDKASKDGFGVAFRSSYQELYRKNIHVCRIELPTTALNDLKTPKAMQCPDCHSKMKKCISFVCEHPPWELNE